MSKYEFMNQVENSLKNCPALEGAWVEGNVYYRNNDTECLGVSIRRGDALISPVFYLDRFYDAYCRKKMTLDEVVSTIIDHFRTVSEDCRRKASEVSLEYETCRECITYRLISAEKNARFLSYLPHIPFLDMAIIFTIVLKIDESGLESIRVTNDLMESWKVKVEDLMALAKVNTPRIFPVKVETMGNVMKRFLGLDEEMLQMVDLDSPMLLLSNMHETYGATTLIYDDQPSKIGELLEDDYYVIPSSVHEVLILPASEVGDPSTINPMIQEINEEHLENVDVLSDRAYLYKRSDNRFYF